MAVYQYGSNDISFSTFITWSNTEKSLSNLDIANAFSDMYPNITSNYDINNTVRSPIWIFYGTAQVRNGIGGTIGITSPYTVSQTSGIITIKNVILSSYSITLEAIPAYGYTFDAWRSTAGTGAGVIISTSATLTISVANNNYQPTEYYARFI